MSLRSSVGLRTWRLINYTPLIRLVHAGSALHRVLGKGSYVMFHARRCGSTVLIAQID